MRNGEEGVSYRLVFLNGSTAVKTVNFVNGTATDSTAFSTEGNYTIALVAGTAVLQQYASLRVGNPPAETYTLTGTIHNNPGSSAIIFTVDGNVVASGSQVEEGKTVHVEITNATENWEAFMVNNMTKITAVSGTSRVVDFVMPSANASCVASFTAPTPSGIIQSVEVDGQTYSDPESIITVDMQNVYDINITFVNNGNGAKFAWRKDNTLSGSTAITTSPQTFDVPGSTGTYDLCVLDSNDEVIETFGTWTMTA